MEKSSQELRSRIIIGFFAFVLGSLVSTLLHSKNPAPSRQSELFSLFNQPFTLDSLPDELASRLAGQLTESDERTRKLLEVAAYAALERALEKKHPKAQQYAEQLKTVEISEEEITRFWENNRARIQLPFHQAQPLIKTLLLQNKTQARLRGLMQSLTTSGELDFNPVYYRTLPLTPAISSLTPIPPAITPDS